VPQYNEVPGVPVVPKKRAKNLTQKEKEKWFVSLFINKFQADSANVAACEKRAHLKAGSGLKILKRKKVQEEIRLRMEATRQEQARAQQLSEAVAKAEERLQERLAKNVGEVQRKKIALEVLDHELMCGVEGLDWNRFPKEKLDAIKAAYIVYGTLESGNTRRLIPPEHLQQNQGQGTYSSLFERLALKSPSGSALEAPSEQDGVYDLIPRPAAPVAVAEAFPAPGEPIQDSPPTSKSDPNVITVEVG
jgi:hypothetical protein